MSLQEQVKLMMKQKVEIESRFQKTIRWSNDASRIQVFQRSLNRDHWRREAGPDRPSPALTFRPGEP